MLKIILLILTASATAAAQTTWKGLKFGMSEAELRKEYQGSLEKKLVQNGEYELFDKDQKLLKWPATAGPYGKWISEDGECQLTIHDVVYNPRKIFTCKKLWKSDGQTISMYWSVENQRLSFFALTYKPLPSDL